MRAEVKDDALEITVPRGDAVLAVISMALWVALLALAGWQIAVVALGLSLAGAVAVDLIPSDLELLGR